jgi:hypothetical protein
MSAQPSRNVRRLFSGKRSGQTRQGDDGGETEDETQKEQSQFQSINSPYRCVCDALDVATILAFFPSRHARDLKLRAVIIIEYVSGLCGVGTNRLGIGWAFRHQPGSPHAQNAIER